MAAPEDWKLPTAAQTCARCSAVLQPGERVTTSIRLPPTGPERTDVCAACGKLVDDLSETFFWRHTIAASGPSRPVVDYALLRELFARLLVTPGAHYERLAYLVALVLVRKRHLRLIGFSGRAGAEVMLVTRGAGQPQHEVPAPFLTPEDMLPLRDELTRLLHAEIPLEDLGAGVDPVAADERPAADSGAD